MATPVKGQLIAITGAASGIGRATSLLLAKNEALLSLADIDEEAVERFAQELTDNGVEGIFWRQVDVTNREQTEAWIGDTVKHFGKPLDGAVNLAGIGGTLGKVRDFNPDDYEDVFSINVRGTLNCMSAEIRNMRTATATAGGGSIVNAGSVAGLGGKPAAAVYCASKFAVIGITKAAAREEAESGIRINAIAPGFVQTPLVEKLDARLGFPLPHEALLGRRARPDEAAKLIQFLLSEDSSYTTGSVYPMDGGMIC